MRDQVVTKIKEALAKTLELNSTDNINVNADLKEEYGLDSMSSLTFLMNLENMIDGFVIDPDTLDSEHLSTVNTISDYVMQEIS